MDGERRETRRWLGRGHRRSRSAVSATGPPPAAERALDATDCLVTPGLVNSHHHLFQNLTRAFPPMTDKPLFGWLQSLYPLWRVARHRGGLRVGVGRSGRAGAVGCTTSTDHLYLHPRGAGDLLTAEIEAARDLGHAVPPDPRVDVAVGEGRRPPARRRRRGRRRDPRRLRRRGGAPSRPIVRGDDAESRSRPARRSR